MEAIIRKYGLLPHPEGGHFREFHRSPLGVRTADGRARAALTSIHYLLGAGEVSRWHRVASDEVWHFGEGDGLELHLIDPGLSAHSVRRLGPDAGAFTAVVPAGTWQAARSLGRYSLVTCDVAPGFSFDDFELLADSPDRRRALFSRFPEAAEWDSASTPG